MDQIKIGNFIKTLRKEKGMTQEELAFKLGVSNKSISRWENGNTMPDISLLNDLCEELGITISELLNGERIDDKDLAISQKSTMNVLEFETSKQLETSKRINKFLLAGNIIILMAILQNHLPYLNLIFVGHAVDFMHGALYGAGLMFDIIGIYNSSHNITLQERKKELLRKWRKAD